MRAPLALLLAVLTVLATACGTSTPTHVRIGVVAPLSGPRAFIGVELVNGATLAVAKINREGGLLGRDVELVVIDDADLVDVPGSLADLAELQRVSAVLGPETPSVLLGPRSPLTRRSVPALLPTAFSGDLSTASTFVARTIPGARVQAASLAWWLRTERQGSKVAILVADVVESGTVLADLEAGFGDEGVEVVAVVEADGESANLLPAVRRLRDEAADADLVLLWGLPTAAARATMAARDLGWDVQLAVPASSFVAEYRSLVGHQSEGVVLPFPYRDAWFESDILTDLMLAYYGAYGLGALPQLDTLVLDVPVVAVAAYDAVGIIAAGVEKAASRDPAKVAAAMSGLVHEGVLRTYDFTAGETWAVDEVFIARFHELTTIFDADPRLDIEGQRELFTLQVTADYVPDALLEGPAGALLERLLTRGRANQPDYRPVLPAPGPVGRPDPDRHDG